MVAVPCNLRPPLVGTVCGVMFAIVVGLGLGGLKDGDPVIEGAPGLVTVDPGADDPLLGTLEVLASLIIAALEGLPEGDLKSPDRQSMGARLRPGWFGVSAQYSA
jgi:hypothetical protein